MFVGEFGFCLLKILLIVAITYIILQIYYGQDFFHATFLTNIFTAPPPPFWPQWSHYPLFAFENYFWNYKTENIASLICHCISGNPAYGGSPPGCRKARGVNLPYLDTRHPETDIWQKNSHKKRTWGLMWVSNYIYRVIIFLITRKL